jgi:dihydroxyacetone kinase
MEHRRQFVNQPDDFVEEALEGLELTYPSLVAFDKGQKIVTRRVKSESKVGLVAGGGSGHEPLHTSFVGVGMLDVAVPGAVFASPTAIQIQAGTVAANNGHGVLQIIKNYTGDVLNFEIAADMASDDGIDVQSVLVDDDLASDSDNGGPGRRGTAAVIAVEKICGALAESGADLTTIAQRGKRLVSRSSTMSLALEACAHPGSHQAAFELAAEEVEFGVGIHGERGIGRIPFATVDDLVEQLTIPVLERLELERGTSVIAMVNGLGGAIPLELSVAARQVHRLLAGRGITVARSLVGSYVTSLDMHGISVTLVRVDDDDVAMWDAPVRTPALVW